MRTKGRISSWNDAKGFGFITPDSGGNKIFIHINEFNIRHRRPAMGETITYTTSTDKLGRPCAINATTANDSQPKKHSTQSLFVTALFLSFVGGSVLIAKIPPQIFWLYLAASLLAFIMYALDKSAAQKGTWRTSESTLHALSLIGGWPGALVAQQTLRHKSKKQSFRFVFWITVILNCGAFAWLFTPNGFSSLQSLISKIV